MKSTGEVMGISEDFGIAFAKAQAAAGNTIPTEGTAFISVNDHDKGGGLSHPRAPPTSVGPNPPPGGGAGPRAGQQSGGGRVSPAGAPPPRDGVRPGRAGGAGGFPERGGGPGGGEGPAPVLGGGARVRKTPALVVIVHADERR